MFYNLENEMLKKQRMSIRNLAELTNIKQQSLKNKLDQKTQFKLNEMKAIQKVFPGCTLEYLFKTE